MANCHACSADMGDKDRFCRQCGAPVATLVGDLIDTFRFNPDAPPSAARSSGVLTNPFPCALPVSAEQGSSPLYKTASLRKRLRKHRVLWLVAILFVVILIAGGIAFFVHEDRVREAEGAVAEAASRRAFGESVQNMFGFQMGRISDAGYPEIKGIFIEGLTSDDSPAALAGIQAGDVVMEINGQMVRNSGELAEVMKTLSPGTEVAVKIFREGETVTARVKVSDPAFAPPQPQIPRREQGFMGVWGNRRPIPGTRKWGVEIYNPVRNSPADIAGLQAGDFITEFDGRAIKTSTELARRIQSARPRSKVVVKFYRGTTEQTVEMILGHLW
ncbi:MAG: PDZ domain-containing protein [Acidobacteriota bacterium]